MKLESARYNLFFRKEHVCDKCNNREKRYYWFTLKNKREVILCSLCGKQFMLAYNIKSHYEAEEQIEAYLNWVVA
jgi:transcription elongation factor Elf1